MPLAPPVIKIVSLLSFIITYLLNYGTIDKVAKALCRSTQTQRPPDARRGRASLGLQRSRHVIDQLSARAGQRSDDDAIGRIQIAHADWGKERLDGHDGAPGQGIKR